MWQYAAAYGDPLYLLMAVEYLPAGVALCWAYERTGSIWSPIFLHAMIDDSIVRGTTSDARYISAMVFSPYR